MRFITQAAKVLNEQKKSKRRLAVFMCLAAVVALGTVAALKMYGQAMSHKEKRLICTVEAHRHTDVCYDADGNLVCGQADYLVHTHNDDCYGADGELVCHLPEIAAHTHTDVCYTEEDVLVCTEQEQAHQHTDACYTPQRGELTCQMEEHTHDDSCYDSETGELTCQLEEHQHGDTCYAWEEVLTCPYAAGGHQHNSKCYTRERGELTCQLEEHTHGDDCYDENGELTCQIEEHTHDDNCYAWEDVLTCQLEETPAGHTHTDACYEKKKVLTCGQLELHTHTEDCYDENGALACGLLELKEHTHQEECFETVELTDEEVTQKLEQEKMEESFQGEDPGNAPSDEGTSENVPDVTGNGTENTSGNSVSSDEAGSVSGNDISGNDISGNSVSGNNVSGDSVSENSMSENDVHVHDENCYDAAGGLMCGYDHIKEPEITQTYKDEDGKYIVTAKYSKRANIPDGAELRAELITAESGGKHYEEREAEIREALEDETASMNALIKIGFYVDEEEVEPQNDVVITVQFLDENGMKDGSPIAIVHFAEGGSKVINGGKAKDRSTTFKTNRFSEFGIVEGYEVSENELRRKKDDEKKTEEEQIEEKMVPISETCEYNNEMFHALFHIEGEVKVTAEQARAIEAAEHRGDKASGTDKPSATEAVEDDAAETEDETVEEEGSSDTAENEEETLGDATTEEEYVPESNAGEGEKDTDVTVEDDDDSIETGADTEMGDVETSTDISDSTDSSDGVDNTDSSDSADVSDAIETPSGKGLEFKVEPVDEHAEEFSEDYRAVVACMEEAGQGDDQIMLQVMAYSLLCNGEKLDMSECKVTMEVTPSKFLKKTADEEDNEASDEAGETEEVTLSLIQTMESDAADASVNEKTGRILKAASVSELDSSLEVALERTAMDGVAAAYVESQANPEFTVEFYANIEQLATSTDKEASGKKSITVIDTSKDEKGTGGNLPVNGGTLKKKNIYLNDDNTVVKKTRLTQVYSPNKYHYIDAPGLVYFNKLAKNKNYKLTEIRVKRSGSDTWETYSCANNKEWHFTNKAQTQENDKDNFILVTAGATIRLVHDINTIEQRNPASFYDYDITNGKVYKADSTESGTYDRKGAKTHDSGDVWYMYTKRQGINSNSTDQTFGFGNSEDSVKTTMGKIEGNWANAKNAAYGSPTFGLVTSLNSKGELQYKSGVKAPKLFNEGSAKGKAGYTGNLVFSQQGDTYTFTGAEVWENGKIASSKTGVDKFTRQRDNWNGSYYFAGNDFYPLDGVSSAGKTDLMFGSPGSTKRIYNFSASGENRTMPASDDGKNHNHYFGMYYTIDFDLVKDYIGPLEYLFYGDDDMWVFLQKGEDAANAKLVCDIGGVHSSVGEYVNLWDYIKKGDASAEGHYKLSFFYTERGASGSTCWMQFTLPSVSFSTTSQDTGQLRIEKQLTSSTDIDQEFGFTIEFRDKDGNPLMNDYSYTKHNKKTGSVVANDILIWNNSKFTLKADEYIEISFLPDGSSYTIQEIGPVNVTQGGNGEPGVDLEWTEDPDNPYIPSIAGGNPTDTSGKITGSITKDSMVEITYNNIGGFELPETGGSGSAIYLMLGVFCIMTGAVLVYRKRIVARRS